MALNELTIDCYSLTFYHNFEKYLYLTDSNKILLPSSFLNFINSHTQEIEGNIILELISATSKIIVTVESFIDDISDAYVPLHIMENLFIEDGKSIKIKIIDCPKGEKLLLQAHSSEFLELENYKEFLENELCKNYDILSKNDVISMEHESGKIYKFNVIDTNPSDCIYIRNTDIMVDFIEPVDYNEYLKRKNEEILREKRKKEMQEKEREEKEREEKEQERIRKEKGYIPFGGTGYSLK